MSLPMGWGKVVDIGIAQNQLIGATFSQTNVSTFVVDISRVQPLGGVANVTHAPPISTSGTRRSFVAERPPTHSSRQVPKEEPSEESAAAGGDDKDDDNAADINDPEDFCEVFQVKLCVLNCND